MWWFRLVSDIYLGLPKKDIWIDQVVYIMYNWSIWYNQFESIYSLCRNIKFKGIKGNLFYKNKYKYYSVWFVIFAPKEVGKVKIKEFIRLATAKVVKKTYPLIILFLFLENFSFHMEKLNFGLNFFFHLHFLTLVDYFSTTILR